MHSFQVVLHRNIRKIREIRGRYIHAKVVSLILICCYSEYDMFINNDEALT